MFSRRGFYENLKALDLPTEFEVNIEKDIIRTQVSLEIREKAKRVLQAYAIANPYVGYTQGMNFIVAFLLENGFEED